MTASTEFASVYQSLSCTGRAKTWTQCSRCSLMEYHYVSIKHSICIVSCTTHWAPLTMISSVSFMLKVKKNKQKHYWAIVIIFKWHYKKTHFMAAELAVLIIGSFSDLVINPFLERAYVLKAQRPRWKHFLDMWERRHLHMLYSRVHTQGKWLSADNSDLNLWGIRKLLIYYMNFIAYSPQSDPARPNACCQQWHQSSVLSLKTWPTGTSSLFRGNLGMQIYAFCTFGG